MTPQTKFIIFGQGRSGTTLLKQLLNSHPKITCEGELLNIKDGYITNKYLLKVAYRIPKPFFNVRVFQSKTTTYGFTLLYHQCRNPRQLIKNLCNSGWKIINLHRENTMEQALSYLVALQTNNWHNWEGKINPIIKIHVDPDAFLQRMAFLNRVKDHEQNLLKNYNHVKIDYESGLKDKKFWQPTADKIFDYLGVESCPVEATLKKTYARPYSQFVANYTDLKGMI